ncbi:protein-tyrosine phosphatase-like protein [Phyllosticta paracitricarpa]|uniref:protein-tyrosine-phosphatase n=1 Tax=Phyllosticta paracitricarpa TaxID=2016321 RepID=A0ABR1MYS9_9PEZI
MAGLLDKVPGGHNLYIGGLFTLRRRDALESANITHVLSVLRLPLDQDLFAPFREHMVVEVDDVDDEDLLQHFPATNRFIQRALDCGGGVLVHCAMGKSRSATCVMAYLMHKHHITPHEALDQVRQARALCEPNEGFMKQLEIYHAMGTPDDVQASPAYQRWLYQREVELSRACGTAPEADKIRFEDEHANDSLQQQQQQQQAALELRCRKCSPSPPLLQIVNGPSVPCVPCASWMRPELEQGKLDGRLECPNPKCRSHVGKYAWQGMRCSCGDWVVPAISLAKGRIDEVDKDVRAHAALPAVIRRPPLPGGGAGAGHL